MIWVNVLVRLLLSGGASFLAVAVWFFPWLLLGQGVCIIPLGMPIYGVPTPLPFLICQYLGMIIVPVFFATLLVFSMPPHSFWKLEMSKQAKYALFFAVVVL